MGDDMPLDFRIVSGQIENAQKRLEDRNFNRRKNVLSYDDVMNQQRNIIYSQRADVLDGADLHSKIENMIKSTITEAVEGHLVGEIDAWELNALKSKYMGLLCNKDDFTNENITKKEILDTLLERAMLLWKSKEELFGEEGAREMERIMEKMHISRC